MDGGSYPASALRARENVLARLMGARDARGLIATFLETASGILGATQAAIAILDETGAALADFGTREIDAAALRASALDRSRFPGCFLGADAPVRSGDRAWVLAPLLRGGGLPETFLGLAIRRRGSLCGWVFFAGKRDAADFGEEDARIASTLVAQFALVHENLALHRAVEEDAVRLLEAAKDHERSQEALAEEAVRRRILFEDALDGVFVVDEDCNIIEANQSFAAMLRCTPRQVLAMSPARWHATYARRPFASRKGSFEACIERPDGTSFEAQVSYNLAQCGGRALLFNVCRDVSERNRDERALVASAVELRSLSRRIAQGEESARRRIARELHDRIGGGMTALGLNLTVLRNSLPEGVDPSFTRRLDDSLALLGETTRATRELMAELRPPVLDDYGLGPALRWYGGELSKRTGLDIVVTVEGCDERLPADCETALFRLVQEALTNVVKHANARTVRISLEREADLVTLAVGDDGAGFEPTGESRTQSWGLVGMRERAEGVGAHLWIDSAPGQGTRVIVKLKARP